MPELPEVEFARRQLEAWAVGRTVAHVRADANRVLGGRTPASFARAVTGAAVSGVERRGKNLLVTLVPAAGKNPLGLFIHLGMTGKLSRRANDDEPPRHSRVSFELDDGHVVHYRDMRLFGRVEVGPLDEMRARVFGPLGPDPLSDDVDGKTLAARAARRGIPVKLALMDQSVLAGVGNIQASEALWRAKLSPFRPASSLDGGECGRLARGIRETIEYTLADAGEVTHEITYVEEPGSENPFLVYEKAGEPCRRCKTPIRRAVLGGRSTYWCPRCQPGEPPPDAVAGMKSKAKKTANKKTAKKKMAKKKRTTRMKPE